MFSVSAIDADIGLNGVVQYFLFGAGSQYVTINQSTGEIRVANTDIDFEVVNVMENPLELTLIAQDSGEFEKSPIHPISNFWEKLHFSHSVRSS